MTDAAALASSLREDERAAQILHWQKNLNALVLQLEAGLAAHRQVEERHLQDIKQRKEALYRELNTLEMEQMSVEQSLDAIGKPPPVIDLKALTSLEETFGIVKQTEPNYQQPVSPSPAGKRKKVDLWNAVPRSTLPERRRSDPDATTIPISMTPSRPSSDNAGNSHTSGDQTGADDSEFSERSHKRRKIEDLSEKPGTPLQSPGPITRSMARKPPRMKLYNS